MLIRLLVMALALSVVGLQAKERPEIGVVLSGGGAKGAAHIGVLRVLEQNHIPVDHIAGTSMGAYIAGLYALGYSADDIESIMMSMDFNTGFDDDVPREDLSYRHKQQHNEFPLPLKMGFDGSEVKFPKGALQGQTMRSLIRRSVGTIPELNHFDDLAIPLRTVATNLADRSEVVLDSGNLVVAMQASMTVPGALAPIEYQGKMLVDGGMANNLPVSVVKEMGADIIIAVDIGTPLKSQDELKSVFDVVDQLTGYLTNMTRDQQVTLMSEQDILLVPEIDGVGTSDFDLMPEMIPRGEKAAKVELARLRELSISEEAYRAYQDQKIAVREFWLRKGRGELMAVELNNNSWVNDAHIMNALGVKPGELLEQDEIENAIARVYALNEFEQVDAHIDERPEGHVLVLDVAGKSWGPNLLELGLRFEDNFDDVSRVNVDVAYTVNNLHLFGAQWRNELGIGNDQRVKSELYLPLETTQKWYLRGHFEYHKELWDSIIEDEAFPFKEVRRDSSNFTVGAGINIGTEAQLELSYMYETGDLENQSSNFFSNLGEYEVNGARLTFGYDSLDQFMFPTEGTKLLVSVAHLDERSDLTFDDQPRSNARSIQYEFQWVGATHWDQHSGFIKTEYQSVNEDGVSLSQLQSLGGFLNLSGFYRDSLFGSHRALAAGVYTYDLSEGTLGLSIPVYVGFSLEAGNVWLEKDSVDMGDLIYSGSLFLGAETKLGPAALAWGHADTGDDSFYLFLGKSF